MDVRKNQLRSPEELLLLSETAGSSDSDISVHGHRKTALPAALDKNSCAHTPKRALSTLAQDPFHLFLLSVLFRLIACLFVPFYLIRSFLRARLNPSGRQRHSFRLFDIEKSTQQWDSCPMMNVKYFTNNNLFANCNAATVPNKYIQVIVVYLYVRNAIIHLYCKKWESRYYYFEPVIFYISNGELWW